MKRVHKQTSIRLDKGVNTLSANNAPVSFYNLPEWKDGS